MQCFVFSRFSVFLVFLCLKINDIIFFSFIFFLLALSMSLGGLPYFNFTIFTILFEISCKVFLFYFFFGWNWLFFFSWNLLQICFLNLLQVCFFCDSIILNFSAWTPYITGVLSCLSVYTNSSSLLRRDVMFVVHSLHQGAKINIEILRNWVNFGSNYI